MYHVAVLRTDPDPEGVQVSVAHMKVLEENLLWSQEIEHGSSLEFYLSYLETSYATEDKKLQEPTMVTYDEGTPIRCVLVMTDLDLSDNNKQIFEHLSQEGNPWTSKTVSTEKKMESKIELA